MKQLGRITAIYDHGQITAEQDHTVLSMDRIIEAEDDNTVEFHAVITNLSDQEIFLEKVCLFEAESLDSFDIGSEPYTVFHSGRHKNDMPGVFVTGRRDACMEDVSSVMAETGTGLNTAETAAVVSDHLTMIQGSNGKTLSVAFLTGRDQLFETRILLDETGEFAGIVSSVIFRVYIKPGQSAVTETLRIARVNDADAEVQSFAERKAELYGARNTRHPAGVDSEDTVHLGEIPPHEAEVLVVQKSSDAPIIVCSDGHYTLGAELKELKIENDQLILKRTPVLPVSTEYTVLLPAGRAFQGSKTMAFALDRDTEEVILPADQKRKI